MLRVCAFIFGILLALVGILGFVPTLVVKRELFLLFRVNGWSNVINVIAGFFGFLALFIGRLYARVYFQVVGIIYGIWAVLGFMYQQNRIFGVIANNMQSTWLYVIVAIVALILGFG